MVTDYRRETVDLIKKLKDRGMTHTDIATAMGVTVTTIGRWFNEEVTPRQKELNALRQYVDTGIKTVKEEPKGEVDILLKQISHLQGQIAILQNKQTETERKMNMVMDAFRFALRGE